MQPVEALHDATVDRCERCHGLFVSERALAQLQRNWFLWPSSSPRGIDCGSRSIGRRYDSTGAIDCPACGAPMSGITAPEQAHLWLEQCGACHGVFFDAGELTDLRYTTLADWVRDLVRPART